jgi:hypothetical protein
LATFFNWLCLSYPAAKKIFDLSPGEYWKATQERSKAVFCIPDDTESPFLIFAGGVLCILATLINFAVNCFSDVLMLVTGLFFLHLVNQFLTILHGSPVPVRQINS